jgi:hypothetical protein
MRKRRHVARLAYVGGILATALLLVAGPMSGADGLPGTEQDRAATRAYYEADGIYQEALLATASSARANAEALISKLGEECPSVLAGARAPRGLPFAPPRQRGEEDRTNRQFAAFQEELSLALGMVEDEPARAAGMAFASAVRGLRWNNQLLTAYEHARADALERELNLPPPDVCADLKAWVASGDKTLSPATKALVAAFESDSNTSDLFLLSGSEASIEAFEVPSDESLARAALRAERERRQIFGGLRLLTTHLKNTLGLIGRQEAEAAESPPEGSTEIAHGRTAAGGAYTIWVEPKHPPYRAGEIVCEPRLQAEEEDKGKNGRSRTVSNKCLSRSDPEPPTVECSEGFLTIEGQVSAEARQVRLVLSDQRRIVSAVAVVPVALGGPFGFYYQALDRPTPTPVRLEELDQNGKLLRAIKLRQITGCRKHERPPNPPGAERTLVIGSEPAGPAFVIKGQRSPAEHRLAIEMRVVDAAEASVIPYLEGPDFPAQLKVPEKPARTAHAFAWTMRSGCQPHEYAILYGLLRSADDTIVARSSGKLIPLKTVRLPASLHSNGELAYAQLPSVPTQLILRTPQGSTVLKTDLAAKSSEQTQICQAEAEPSG